MLVCTYLQDDESESPAAAGNVVEVVESVLSGFQEFLKTQILPNSIFGQRKNPLNNDLVSNL
jgi:hypothetical protein